METLHPAPNLPPEQVALLARCRHPNAALYESDADELDLSILDRFERMVARYPDRLAIRSRSAELTYSELNQAANRIASTVVAQRGTGAEPVALMFGQGLPLLAPMFGALKAAKFGVPLDPSYPLDLTARMVADSEARLVLTDTHQWSLASQLAGPEVTLLNVDDLAGDLPEDNLGLSISPESIAYVLYTSGSTGQPKGIMRDHHLTIQPTNICPEDRVVLLSSVSLVAMSLINGTLHAGASLFPFSVREEGTGPLAAWLQEQQITIYHSGSPLFRTFMEGLNDSDVFPSVRVVRLGSQTAFRSDFEHYKKHFSPACILLNGLASTEVVRSHLFYVDRDTQILGSTIPVGYPVDGPIESIVVETDTSSRLQHPRHRNSEALISLIAKKETAHDQR